MSRSGRSSRRRCCRAKCPASRRRRRSRFRRKPAPYSQQGLVESDLIDYTPAIKDSAFKLAKTLPHGSVLHSRRRWPTARARAAYKCSWYAPGATGGVNIDGGTAADPETGMHLRRRPERLEHDRRCRRIRARSSATAHRTTAAACSARSPAPAGYVAQAGARRGLRLRGDARPATTIGGVSILKPKRARRHHRVRHEHRRQEVVGAERQSLTPVTTNDPLFAGVDSAAATGARGQAEVITTKTLVIYGTGRSGGPPRPPYHLYAVDKATGKEVGAVQIPDENDRGADDVHAPGATVHRVCDGGWGEDRIGGVDASEGR